MFFADTCALALSAVLKILRYSSPGHRLVSTKNRTSEVRSIPCGDHSTESKERMLRRAYRSDRLSRKSRRDWTYLANVPSIN